MVTPSFQEAIQQELEEMVVTPQIRYSLFLFQKLVPPWLCRAQLPQPLSWLSGLVVLSLKHYLVPPLPKWRQWNMPTGISGLWHRQKSHCADDPPPTHTHISGDCLVCLFYPLSKPNTTHVHTKGCREDSGR